jgi:hypothetical protein
LTIQPITIPTKLSQSIVLHMWQQKHVLRWKNVFAFADIYQSKRMGYNGPVGPKLNLRFPIWSFNERWLTRWLYKRCSVGLRVRSDYSSTLGCSDKFLVVFHNFTRCMLR